jgi:hypothetical protein
VGGWYLRRAHNPLKSGSIPEFRYQYKGVSSNGLRQWSDKPQTEVQFFSCPYKNTLLIFELLVLLIKTRVQKVKGKRAP